MGINNTEQQRPRRVLLSLTPPQDDFLIGLVEEGRFMTKQEAIRSLVDRAREGALV